MSLADILKLFGSDQPAAAACPIHAARKPKVESPKDSPAPQGPTPTDFTTVFNLNQLEQSRSEFSMRWFSAGKQGKEKLLKLLIAAKYDYNIPLLASKLTNSNTSVKSSWVKRQNFNGSLFRQASSPPLRARSLSRTYLTGHNRCW